jgi:hypothetical protein
VELIDLLYAEINCMDRTHRTRSKDGYTSLTSEIIWRNIERWVFTGTQTSLKKALVHFLSGNGGRASKGLLINPNGT